MMSRVGKEPIAVPSGVDVTVANGVVTVKGPNGTLTRWIDPAIAVEVRDGEIVVTRSDDEREHRALHGLYRALLANMVVGVTEGYRRELEIVGIGYRVAARGSNGLTLQVGYSQPVEIDAPEGITFEVPAPTRIAVTGADKQLVGQVAANIRKVRPPEPYKGKGIRYAGEQIRRKAGKAAAGA
jgi:large subunit ribosomal protein L6